MFNIFDNLSANKIRLQKLDEFGIARDTATGTEPPYASFRKRTTRSLTKMTKKRHALVRREAANRTATVEGLCLAHGLTQKEAEVLYDLIASRQTADQIAFHGRTKNYIHVLHHTALKKLITNLGYDYKTLKKSEPETIVAHGHIAHVKDGETGIVFDGFRTKEAGAMIKDCDDIGFEHLWVEHPDASRTCTNCKAKEQIVTSWQRVNIINQES